MGMNGKRFDQKSFNEPEKKEKKVTAVGSLKKKITSEIVYFDTHGFLEQIHESNFREIELFL